MPNSNTASKNIDKPINHKAIYVVVNLTAQDYEDANLAAKSSHETLAAWIGSLVHTALQP